MPTIDNTYYNASSSPTLYNETRLEGIERVIKGVSNTDDTESCQYKALQWLKYSDSINPPLFADDIQLIQRFSLITMYCALNGAFLSDITLWGSDSSECEWGGISCDNSGFITAVSLNNNGLSGEIPKEILLLTYASQIDLSDNSVTGSIPHDIGDLIYLGMCVFQLI